MAVCSKKSRIKVTSTKNNPYDGAAKQILQSLESGKKNPRICVKCSKVLAHESDALFCRDCFMNPDLQSIIHDHSEIKKKRFESILQKRKDLVEKLQDFTGKTYLEISQERNIPLREAITLVNTLVKAGYLRSNPYGESRKGYVIFELPEFDDFLFVS